MVTYSIGILKLEKAVTCWNQKMQYYYFQKDWIFNGTRLVEYLDKTKDISEKIPIEKLVFDIDAKITQIYQKISESTNKIYGFGLNYFNNHLKSQNQNERYLTFRGKMSVSKDAYTKIGRIIEQDKKNYGQTELRLKS